MNRHPTFSIGFISALPRFALLAAMLLAPLALIQAVQAGSENTIQDNRKIVSGAGLVLVVSLQRG